MLQAATERVVGGSRPGGDEPGTKLESLQNMDMDMDPMTLTCSSDWSQIVHEAEAIKTSIQDFD
jgi:hypothetical protein